MFNVGDKVIFTDADEPDYVGRRATITRSSYSEWGNSRYVNVEWANGDTTMTDGWYESRFELDEYDNWKPGDRLRLIDKVYAAQLNLGDEFVIDQVDAPVEEWGEEESLKRVKLVEWPNHGFLKSNFEKIVEPEFTFSIGDVVKSTNSPSSLFPIGETFTVSKIWIGSGGYEYIRLAEAEGKAPDHSQFSSNFELVKHSDDTGVEATVLAAIEAVLMNQISLDTLTHDLLDSVMSALNFNHNIK